MTRFSRTVSCFAAFAALVGAVGCANGGVTQSASASPELSASAGLPESPAGSGVTLGYFQFVFEEGGTVRVEETEPLRGAQFDVSAYASIIIEDFHFNEEERNWYITASIKNISTYTGYDVWAVFHSLGGKYLVNQDGFIWALPPIFPEPTRCAFIAYGKEQPDRMYLPMYQDTRTIVIHQPEGTPKLPPVGFWIDATLNPRKTPGVEDLHVEPIDDTTYQLTGFIWDHQSPPEDLTVWADCSDFNGESHVPMFDDGEHGDGDPGDNIFGCTFSGDPAPGEYVITVYALDPLQNAGENDVRFWHGETELPCYDFWNVAGGQFQECEAPFKELIDNQDDWEAYWHDCHNGEPMPEIDFEGGWAVYVINLGERPTTGFEVEVYEVCKADDPYGIAVRWIEWIPGENCNVDQVITYPWRVVKFRLLDMPYFDEGREEVYDCEPDCTPVPFYKLAGGSYSCAEPGGYGWQDDDGYVEFWNNVHCWVVGDVPPLPEDPDTIEDGIIYHFGLQMQQRQRTGIYVTIDDVCFKDCDVYIEYTEHFPKEGSCHYWNAKTQPWAVGAVELPPVYCHWTWHFERHEAVYDCEEQDCFDFENVNGGQYTECCDDFVMLIETQEDWENYWEECHPDLELPYIDFDGGWGAYVVHIGERPTTGYEVDVYQVCVSDDPFGVAVRWVEWIPGPYCEVEEKTTCPWRVVTFPLVDMPYFDEGGWEIWWCE